MLEELGPPVQDGETDDIDKEIGHSEGPDNPVSIDLLLYKCSVLSGLFGALDNSFLLAYNLRKPNI